MYNFATTGVETICAIAGPLASSRPRVAVTNLHGILYIRNNASTGVENFGAIAGPLASPIIQRLDNRTLDVPGVQASLACIFVLTCIVILCGVYILFGSKISNFFDNSVTSLHQWRMGCMQAASAVYDLCTMFGNRTRNDMYGGRYVRTCKQRDPRKFVAHRGKLSIAPRVSSATLHTRQSRIPAACSQCSPAYQAT